MTKNEDFWAQWTGPGRVTMEGREDFRCQMASRAPAGGMPSPSAGAAEGILSRAAVREAGELAPAPGADEQTVRIDVAGLYDGRRFKGGILISKEEFDKPDVWQDYVSNQFYAWCAKNRY